MLRRKKTKGDGEGQLCSLCFVNTEHVLWIQHIAYVLNTTADLQQPAVCQLHHEIPQNRYKSTHSTSSFGRIWFENM